MNATFTTTDIVVILIFKLKHIARLVDLDQLKSCRLRKGKKDEFITLTQHMCYCQSSGNEDTEKLHIQEDTDKLAQIKAGKFPNQSPSRNTPELAKQVWENASQIPAPDWYLANFAPNVPSTKLGIVEEDISPDTPFVSVGRITAEAAMNQTPATGPVSAAIVEQMESVRASKPVLGFRNTVFTNMYPCAIVVPHKKLGELTFKCLESAYVACKCGRMCDIKQFTRMNGYQAKRAGGKYGNLLVRADWDEIKLQVMESLLRRKFQIPELKAALLATGDGYLEETNNWHDSFWGRCTCDKCRSIEWHNNLGKLLMQIRAELQEVN